LFDDCWNPEPHIGPQPAPVPGVHNSQWLQSPGPAVANDPVAWGRLEDYVTDIVGRFAEDERILAWDLYNEPGNRGQNSKSLPLLKAVFAWARAARPSQPLTAGVWSRIEVLNALQLAESDIISFHNYNDADSLIAQIAGLKKHGRPVICTEWMRRPISTVETHLAIFKRERVGCYNWGLVSGKTQTIYGWRSEPGGPEPPEWFHDLLRPDGTPFDPGEIALFREATASP
ncbi:MAG: cellulase family glycosylhydrolase, partial [Candidatus Hydrogenedentes bacterium]|nr:cellulase family glycosylhydrolase [Candidatus Hydrogenedentota bacterium]